MSERKEVEKVTVEELLPLINRPSRYTGNEHNVVRKDWARAELRWVLAFPDLYEIGMSHQGIQILYHLLNRRENFLAERVYAPDLDLEKLLRSEGLSLFSLESQRPVGEFDLLGITLPFELCYSNILTILASSGLPPRSAERDASHPLVIGGGPCAFHPEPVAEFFDAILLGDGEEAVLAISDCVLAAKGEGLSRPELLVALSRIPGVYIPSLFEPLYGADGAFAGIRPLRADYPRVRRTVLPSIELVPPFDPPLVPVTRIVHDRLGVEIARGCTRGCRFCQAGVIYRPVRERSPEQIMAIARAGIESGGFDELALLSLSTGDYACLPGLLGELMDHFVGQRVSVSMPSMRVGTLTPEIMAQVKRVRKTGFTVAPEAGSDRLRQVINKGITEEALLQTCKDAFALGWKLIKFYFMFGLPTETQEDLAAIPALAQKALRLAGGGGRQINVSAGTFVPKPHTPFQWEPQISIEEGFERIDFLRKNMPGRNTPLKWNDPRTSYLEGVFSRGDRRLSAVIEAAWRLGARLDSWSEHFNLNLWRQAAESCGIDLDYYLRRRGFDEPLPWQHLESGVDDEFLRQEYEKAIAGDYTPDCRVHGCQGCGLCDFKIVKPVVYPAPERAEARDLDAAEPPPPAERGAPPPKRSFIYRLDYSRLERARFLGHLELLQLVFRALKRAHLPLNFSQGFNPSPCVSFSQALPAGTESRAEYILLDLYEPLADRQAVLTELNRQLPGGVEIQRLELAVKKQAPRGVSGYEIRLPGPVAGERLAAFMASEEYILNLPRKKVMRAIDVRPQVTGLHLVEDQVIHLAMISAVGMVGVKPLELMRELLDLTPAEIARARVVKSWYKELETESVPTEENRTNTIEER